MSWNLSLNYIKIHTHSTGFSLLPHVIVMLNTIANLFFFYRSNTTNEELGEMVKTNNPEEINIDTDESDEEEEVEGQCSDRLFHSLLAQPNGRHGLPLGLCKGTVSGLWNTVEIPIGHMSLQCIMTQVFRSTNCQMDMPANCRPCFIAYWQSHCHRARTV